MRPLFLLLVLVLAGGSAGAQKKGDKMPPEDAQMRKIVATLRSGSADEYVALFPTEEIIIGALEGDGWAAAEKSRQTPILQEKAKVRFQSVLEQGAEMGIRWNIVSLTRFELTKARLSRDTMLERLAPVRFEGYLFVRDPLLRKTFGLRVTDVWEIAGELRGGLLSQVFPAVSVTDFEKHAIAQIAAEKKGEKYVAFKPVPKDDDDEDDEKAEAPVSHKTRIVAERHFYRGTFDKDLPVVLYVQGYKGSCPSGICSWAGTMRVGDEDWIMVKIVRKDKQWTFTEVPENGVMDLTEKKGGGYEGTWNATDDKMGYEVQLQDQPPSKRMLREAEEFMDSVF